VGKGAQNREGAANLFGCARRAHAFFSQLAPFSDAWARRRQMVFIASRAVGGAFAHPTNDRNVPRRTLVLLDRPIETKDLILRSLAANDAQGPYAAWMHDEEVTRFLEVRFSPPDEAALEAFIVEMNGSQDNLLLGLFARAQPQRHIGNIKLGPIDKRHKAAAIGIAIGAKDCWGRGFATQAVAALSDYAFDVLGLERLEAGFYADNEASQRAFRRAGFVLEGRRHGGRLLNGVRTDEILMGRVRRSQS
jgi:[ribosomal protein S5]-alanine N-acetyltransferase